MKHLLLLKKGNPCHQRLNLIQEMACKWEDAGCLLGLSAARLNGIEKDKQGNSYECCRSVMKAWLDNGGTEDYPNKWDGVSELLKDLMLSNLDKTLQEML